MSQNVSVKIQISDGGTFKDVTVNVEDLAKAFNAVKAKASELEKSFVDMASLGQIADNVSSAIQNLSGYISELTSDYKSAVEAETKLATAMRNTMDATDEEIQSIKDFCDEQERMGVVAGDVQVSAAQELATYLEFSDSLKTLIPVVNDMTVQQYGLGASAESATQIATMLGKVMNGQTKALSRYGYEFTEAQEAVLLYGNEAERAAMLAEVVGQSVGGMNYEMAKTPVGIMQQAENRLGKMRESIGAFAIQIEPALKNLNMFTSTTADIVKVAQAIEAAKKSAVGMKVASLAAAVSQKTQAAAARILGVSEISAATATKTLKIEMAALQATITLGVSLAISGLVALLSKLSKKSSDAESAVEGVDEATEEYGRAAGEARGQIMLEIGALSDIMEKHKKEKDKVQELNEKYGEAFGYHQTAAEWYDILTTKSEAYCRQLGYEAKAKLLASQYGEALVALDEARKAEGEFQGVKTEKRLTTFRDSNGKMAGWGFDDKLTKEYAPFVQALEDAEKNVANIKKQLDDCTAAGKEAAEAFGALNTGGSVVGSTGSKLTGITKDIEDYRKSILAAVQTNQVFNNGAAETGVQLKAMESGITSLIGKYGAENSEVKKLVDEYFSLRSEMLGFNEALPKLDGIFSKATTKDKGLAKTSDDLKQIKKDADGLGDTQDTITSIAGAFGSLGEVIGSTAGSWLEWSGNLLRAIAQSLPAIATLVAALKVKTEAEVEDAAAGSASSVAATPVVGPILAAGAAATVIASILAAISSIPKFAAGGIAYGPTLGLFGEYAGASHNPEVVAPLDKLPALLNLPSQRFGVGRDIKFHIEGRDLVTIYQQEMKIRSRG